MQDVQRLARKLVKQAKKENPGLSDASAQEYAKAVFETAVDFGLDTNVEPGMLGVMFQAKISDDAEAGSNWAVEIRDLHFRTVVLPAYTKALKASVDPVAVLRADLGVDEEEAKKLAEKASGRVTDDGLLLESFADQD